MYIRTICFVLGFNFNRDCYVEERIVSLGYIVFISIFIINRPMRPEGPRRCPGRGNAGGLFVFLATFGYHLCTDTIVTTCYYRLLQVTHVTTGY